MITVIFEYDVAVENQEAYVKATKTEIKPLWESIGCLAYDIWQVKENETGFVKTMLFEDAATMKSAMADEKADAAKKLFYEFAQNISRKVCLKKT
jgi:quinol monooxygenase YgiN